ncbi:MAG: DUF4846 domain-containing protein [Pseudomonadota bacterium]
MKRTRFSPRPNAHQPPYRAARVKLGLASILLLFLPLALAGAPLSPHPGSALVRTPAVSTPANRASRYPWPTVTDGSDVVASRFASPAGATPVAMPPESFGNWLRQLPLLAPATAVHLFDGRPKARQDVHAAVVDLDVGTKDLQQCADAIMRLRAEYLYARRLPIAFHPLPGRANVLAWSGGSRKALERYLIRVFAAAGSASLQAELRPVGTRALEPGDVLVQGGYPGHAVLVLDVAADNRAGRRYLLLGQSYMPAQQFHVLKNLADPTLSPWFDAGHLDEPSGLATPEWRPFHRADVRRFPPPRREAFAARTGCETKPLVVLFPALCP